MTIATRTDESIKEGIVDQLYWDTRIDASKVMVTVDDGQVTFKGEVPTFRAKLAASEDAWLVAGVEGVDNQLTVTYAPTVTVPSDAEIEDNIRDALIWDPDFPINKIDVSVQNGWATLEGTVDALWKKFEADSKALDIHGVLGVTNKLAVVPTDDASDEAIAKDIVDAITRNRYLDVDDIDVTVSNGRVSLSGTVPNRPARAAAYNAALYTPGVVEIDDGLIVV